MAQARSLAAFVVGMAVAGCESSPTSPGPSPSPAVQAGAWKGVLQTTSCTGSCSTTPEMFSLRIAEGGAGVVQFGVAVASDGVPMTVDVTATRAGTAMTVAGAAAIPSVSNQPRNADVRFDLTEAGEILSGTFRYAVTGSETFTKEGRILFANRDTAIFGARFQGRWAGWVNRTACSGNCDVNDPVVGIGAVSLLIAQNGSSATARLNFTELTGSATGTALTLTAREEVAPGGCVVRFGDGRVCLLDVTVSATVDALDRLRGTIAYRVEGIDFRGRTYAFDAVADLSRVARWQ